MSAPCTCTPATACQPGTAGEHLLRCFLGVCHAWAGLATDMCWATLAMTAHHPAPLAYPQGWVASAVSQHRQRRCAGQAVRRWGCSSPAGASSTAPPHPSMPCHLQAVPSPNPPCCSGRAAAWRHAAHPQVHPILYSRASWQPRACGTAGAAGAAAQSACHGWLGATPSAAAHTCSGGAWRPAGLALEQAADDPRVIRMRLHCPRAPQGRGVHAAMRPAAGCEQALCLYPCHCANLLASIICMCVPLQPSACRSGGRMPTAAHRWNACARGVGAAATQRPRVVQPLG